MPGTVDAPVMLAKIRGLISEWRGAIAIAGTMLVCAIGARIIAPGINADVVADFFRTGSSTPLMRMYDWFVGGAVSRGALLAIGVMPYVSARLYMWATKVAVPSVSAMSGSAAGQARVNRWTRGLTFAFALVQSYGFARFVQSLPGAVAHPGAAFIGQTMLVLTASAMCVTWLSERLSGAGDGAPGSRDDDRSGALLLAGGEGLTVGSTPKEPVVIERL